MAKISKTFKRIAIICELVAFISVVLGLTIQGVNYDLAAVLYAIAFGLAIYPLLRLAYEAGRFLPF